MVSSVLKGLKDQKLATQVCELSKCDTFEAASKVALEKEAQREKMEQMLEHEPMEVGSAHKENGVADNFMSIIDTMQRRIEQMHTRLQQTEACLSAPPPPHDQDPKTTGTHRQKRHDVRPAAIRPYGFGGH